MSVKITIVPQPLDDVRICPGSGRIADIGGRLKSTRNGREQLQQIVEANFLQSACWTIVPV
jgi:hypothetical protein